LLSATANEPMPMTLRLPHLLLTLLLTLTAALPAVAQERDGLVEGRDYAVIAGGAPLQATRGKIEVVEVFAYWCHVCNDFQPLVDAWSAKLPGDVAFRYLPAAFDPNDRLARAYFAAEAMAVLPRTHNATFRAIHDLRSLPAEVAFHDVPRQPWAIDGASLTASLVVHPGPTVGYRIETPRASVAYLPDHEPALAGVIGETPPDWISGAGLAAGVDVLFHDAQYSEDEYEARIGWGHSSVADAVTFARVAGARRLLLFHHEPLHDDGSLDRLEEHARSLAGSDGVVATLAREGMVVEV
jgi:thiol-disulfide isomerase/thioredoxin